MATSMTDPADHARDGVLYVSYEGLLEPLGQSQVLAYQERLAGDRPTWLLSFEKPADLQREPALRALEARVAAAGLHWRRLRYHKRPPVLGTAWDVVRGVFVGARLCRRHGLRIVHARSYVPALIALVLKNLLGVRFVFDMRGFWADERVDGGLWPAGGWLYRIAKGFERRFLLRADHVVSLTHEAVRVMRGFDYLQDRFPPTTVIPTCADLDRFAPASPRAGGGFVLGYVGSAGTWYLFDAVATAFRLLRELRPDARLLVVNRHQHDYIRARLHAAGIPEDAFELRSADHHEVPALMATMDAGVFFYRPSYSRAACAPTKLGEFLGCGLPCLANAGVGDMANVVESTRTGIAIASFDEPVLRDAVARLLALAADPDTRARCREAARDHFSLDGGVERYTAVYRALEALP